MKIEYVYVIMTGRVVEDVRSESTSEEIFAVCKSEEGARNLMLEETEEFETREIVGGETPFFHIRYNFRVREGVRDFKYLRYERQTVLNY